MTNLFLDAIRYRKIIQISHSTLCFVHQCFGASQQMTVRWLPKACHILRNTQSFALQRNAYNFRWHWR
jgi:hypothetical protein